MEGIETHFHNRGLRLKVWMGLRVDRVMVVVGREKSRKRSGLLNRGMERGQSRSGSSTRRFFRSSVLSGFCFCSS